MAAWLVGPWLADLMKVWPCGRPADGSVARCPRGQAASLLAAKLAASLGWLVARLLTPPFPGIRCQLMCSPCHPLQMSEHRRERDRRRGKGRRDREGEGQGGRGERAREIKRTAWQEKEVLERHPDGRSRPAGRVDSCLLGFGLAGWPSSRLACCGLPRCLLENWLD